MRREILYNWKARRSGAAMTITGVSRRDDYLVTRRVPNVQSIELVDGQVLATDSVGDTHVLSLQSIKAPVPA